jgi:hypothetical protein
MLKCSGRHLYQPGIVIFGEVCNAYAMKPNPMFLVERRVLSRHLIKVQVSGHCGAIVDVACGAWQAIEMNKDESTNTNAVREALATCRRVQPETLSKVMEAACLHSYRAY